MVCTQCETGYLFDQANGECVDCATFTPGCNACNENAVCTSCDTANNYFLNETTNKCQCIDGYHFDLVDRECSSCLIDIPHCLNCTGGPICNLCSANFGVDSLGHCSSCDVQIAGCLTCDNITSCNGCDQSLKFAAGPVNSQCVCIPNHYYNSTDRDCKTCSSAISNCLSCTNNDICTSCFSGYGLTSSNKCVKCSDVIPGCLSCQTDTQCNICDTEHFSLNEQTGKCECYEGTSLNLTTNQCSDCNNLEDNCIKCNSDHCTECTTSHLLVVNGNARTCEICVSQVIGCLTCLGGSSCGQCVEGGNFRLEGN